MNLKLVQGVQFSHSQGEIFASLPDVLEKTSVKKWQYRMMLSLDGEQQFVEVVRDVKNECDGEFQATDVWMFLDWLVENDLVVDALSDPLSPKVDKASRLPDVLEPRSSRRPWTKVPLQVVGILLVCAVSALGAYFVTPMVISSFNDSPQAESPHAEVAEVVEEFNTGVEEITAVRVPAIAEPKEVTFASRAPIKVEIPPSPAEPSLVQKLVKMRQEMAACQIRRDEYYLLNDEKGYRVEVERISEIAKEIGQIRADITE